MNETIGIDIGGTHTDGVRINAQGIPFAQIKAGTTNPIEKGLETCLQHLLTDEVDEIVVGTTHAMNALLQKEELAKVGVIRLAGHQPESLPPAFGWPQEMVDAVFAGFETISGGHEVDGRTLKPFSPEALHQAAEKLAACGAEALVIQGVFSPLFPEQELKAKELLSIPVTLSHEMGGMGFIERENAALLNAALKPLMVQRFTAIQNTIRRMGFTGKLYLTQNNGCRLSLEQALEIPLLTLSSGATNSFIGATLLQGIQDAIVVDIGGTSTEIGIVKNGFPRQRSALSEIAGIPLNFPMPDVLSIPLGGGSLIDAQGHITGKSVARELKQRGQAFGGSELTLTDAALAAGSLQIPEANPARVKLNPASAKAILNQALERIHAQVERLQPPSHLPVIFVGGGAALFNQELLPEGHGIANALGAAYSEIGLTIEQTIDLHKRDEELEQLKRKGLEKIGSKKARLVNLKVTPYHYMPGHKARAVLSFACPARR